MWIVGTFFFFFFFGSKNFGRKERKKERKKERISKEISNAKLDNKIAIFLNSVKIVS